VVTNGERIEVESGGRKLTIDCRQLHKPLWDRVNELAKWRVTVLMSVIGVLFVVAGGIGGLALAWGSTPEIAKAAAAKSVANEARIVENKSALATHVAKQVQEFEGITTLLKHVVKQTHETSMAARDGRKPKVFAPPVVD